MGAAREHPVPVHRLSRGAYSLLASARTASDLEVPAGRAVQSRLFTRRQRDSAILSARLRASRLVPLAHAQRVATSLGIFMQIKKITILFMLSEFC